MGEKNSIAIIGIGSRFPKAPSPNQFWANILEGRVAFSEIPKDRWNHEVFFSKNQRDTDKAWVASGSFIENVREFSPLHYGIAPRRLEVMDPQQRLLIEATRSAIQDAGLETGGFDRARTGVFTGVSTVEYRTVSLARVAAMQIAAGDFGPAAGNQALRDALLEMTSHVSPMRSFSLAGALPNLTACSVAQTFDLGGPAYAVDAACASASVAIGSAVAMLRSKDIDSAIAGGAYINLTPDNLIAFTRIGAISPSGVCRPFDARADGFVQSDGIGLVFLKRLEDAQRDGNRIYAVIRGSGWNNDGRGEGPMTPRVEGQLEVLRAAYEDAEVSPTSINYFEAHGTATSVGDPVEVEALGTFLNRAGASRPAIVGSVKGNIGHAMSAAGIAGLIKAVKIIEHRMAPPQAGFESPHPALNLQSYPLRILREAEPLEKRGSTPLRVAVSSFGFGGTNSHIILEEPPRTERPRRVQIPVSKAPTSGADTPLPEAVVVSAPSLPLLERHLVELADDIDHGRSSHESLADIAFTLNAARRFERFRAVVGARTPSELKDNLRALSQVVAKAGADAKLPLAASPHMAVYDGETAEADRKVAFLFPGQGAQRIGLLADVRRRFGVFAVAFDELEQGAQGVVPRPLASYLWPNAKHLQRERAQLEAELTATEVCQPAMAALGLSMHRLMERAGVVPDTVLGHSLGEFAAVAAGGALSPIEAVRLVAERGRAMRDLRLKDTGTMAAVMAEKHVVTEHLAGEDDVWIANINHPRQVAISGTTAAVNRACKKMAAAGLDVRPLPVSHAFHSPLLEGVREPMARLLEEAEMAKPERPIASCIASEPHGKDVAAIHQTLLNHATAPVQFSRGLQQAYDLGARIFIQMGAGSTLTGFARATLGKDNIVTIAVGSEEADGGYEVVRGLATLAALGVPVRFEALYAGEKRRVVSLPETPLERQDYWVIRDEPQPKPVMDGPLPSPSSPRGVVTLGASDGEAATVAHAPEGKEDHDALVKLFARQAELLRSHAEIIANQNRVLAGGIHPEGADALQSFQAQIDRLVDAPTTGQAGMTEADSAEPPTPVSPAASEEDRNAAIADVRDRVLEIVARISAFPRESLRPEQRLVDELGFDSLMVADLTGALQTEFPELPPLPESLFSVSTTVGEVAEQMASTRPSDRGADEAAEEDLPKGPVRRYRAVAKPQPRPALTGPTVAGETWLVTEDESELSGEIGAALGEAGAQVVRVKLTTEGVAAPDRLSFGSVNLWPEAFVDGLPAALAQAGIELDGLMHAAGLSVSDAAEFVNPVTALHPLAAALDVQRLYTVTALGGRMGLERDPALPRNVLQAAICGYTKALGRERPNAIIRTIDIDPGATPEDNAGWILDEVQCGDLAPEIGLKNGTRFVPFLEPVREGRGSPRPMTRDDVVLITGGAGEIGALMARTIAASRPKAILLVGRRPLDDRIKALTEELSASDTRAFYLSADATDPVALTKAVEAVGADLGPVTVALHCAGLIEDAPATQKTIESVHRVMNVKVLGVQALLRAFPGIKDVILFSSWAGRFGNAGQVDYSAANDLLDRIAIAGLGRGTRIVSIAWPPWASTSMVRSIPESLRRAMETRGVTFLEDEEGAQIFQQIFSGDSHGVEVIGRDLPAREIRGTHRELFSAEAHPYLEDHQLKGRPVVPLASAADLIAWAFRQSTGSPGGPIVVTDLELLGGVMGADIADLKVDGRRGDRGTTARIEIRSGAPGATKKVAYRASARLDADAAVPRALEEGSLDEPTSLDVAAFYELHTFHGPMLQSVERIDRMTERSIRGVVRPASVEDWLPSGARSTWAFDPCVVDGSFQLAAYWTHAHKGRVGYPTGFSRLTLVRPFTDEPVHCTVVLGKMDDQTFTGDILYSDASGEPYALLEGVRGRFAEVVEKADVPEAVTETEAAPVGANGGSTTEVSEESWNIAKFPEVELLDQRFQMAELMKLGNPYFHVHSGIARDTSVIDGVEMLNYSSYNYLGFSGHPEVIAAAQDAVARYGTSVSASRVASGERPIHQDLERGLAEHVGVEDSVVFVSGHATNVTTIGHLFDRNDLIIHDSLIHDSILQGIYLSGATRRPYPHGDLDALERTLAQTRNKYRRVLLCAEGIYSMDGDICDLPRLVELKKRHRALLLVDEAHSSGVLGEAGRGVAHHYDGVDPNDVDLWMGTLSKSFASCGGYIAGSAALVRYLKYTAPGFVYSAGITPANAAAALKSLELMHAHPDVVQRLRDRSKLFLELARAQGIDTGLAAGAAVIPAIIGNSLECMRLSEALAKRRINVQPIVYPAVEDDAARLRFFLSATHTAEQLRYTVDVLVDELAKVRAETSDGTQPSL